MKDIKSNFDSANERIKMLTLLVDQEFKHKDTLDNICSGHALTSKDNRRIEKFENKSDDHKLSMSLYLLQNAHPEQSFILTQIAIKNIKSLVLETIDKKHPQTSMSIILDVKNALPIETLDDRISDFSDWLYERYNDIKEADTATQEFVNTIQSINDAPDADLGEP